MTKSAFHEFFMCLVVEGALKGSHLFIFLLIFQNLYYMGLGSSFVSVGSRRQAS